VARWTASGALDPTFNADGGPGYRELSFVPGVPSHASAVVVQADGKIVIAGYSGNQPLTGGTAAVALARLNSDGTPDTTFGAGDAGAVVLSYGTNPEWGYAMVAQANDFVVTGGYNEPPTEDFVTARLLPTGGIDPTFAAAGWADVPLGVGWAEAHAIALTPSGQILIAGLVNEAGKENAAVARMTADGGLDSSFQGGTPTGPGIVIFRVTAGDDQPSAIVQQSSGRIIVVGTGNLFGSTGTTSYFAAGLVP
jgi:uncharacterized delta-60 repeat protein